MRGVWSSTGRPGWISISVVRRRRCSATGGSALLGEPDLLHAIVSAVRAEVPADIPFTAKMRLGIADSSLAVDCAQAIEAGASMN